MSTDFAVLIREAMEREGKHPSSLEPDEAGESPEEEPATTEDTTPTHVTALTLHHDHC